MFDLNRLDTSKNSNDGIDFILRDPEMDEPYTIEKDGVLVPVSIKLLGPDSPKYEAIANKSANAFLKEQIASGRQNATPRAGLSVDQLKADAIELCTACTIGWTNFALDDKELPYSPENARMIYTKFALLREQVQAFIAKRANFLRRR